MSEAKAVRTQFNDFCRPAFTKCRKAEDDASMAVVGCGGSSISTILATSSNPVTTDTFESTPSTITTQNLTNTNTTLQEIEELKEEIEELKEEIKTLESKREIALNASTTIEEIGKALQSSNRIRRQAGLRTLAPITSCSDFSSKYDLLLETCKDLKDEDINDVKELLEVLKEQIGNINNICSKNEKQQILSRTKEKAETAKLGVNIYNNNKAKEINEKYEKIKEFNDELASKGESTVSISIVTIPVLPIQPTNETQLLQ